MNTGQRIVLIILVLSLFAGIVTGSQLYYRLTYLLALLMVISWLWSKLALRGLRFRRRARTMRAQVDQIFEERFELDNPNRLPRMWISVRDESTLPGSQGSRVFPVIEAKRGRTYLARTRLVERGVFDLGPTVLESGDPFGLFPISRVISANHSLLVYPMMFDISSFVSPPGLMPGGEALRRRTPQVTPNAAGVRDYAPGDPLNRIHWVSTARRGRLISKEFELDPQGDVWLFLDSTQDNQAALPYDKSALLAESLWKRGTRIELPPSTEEYGVSIAASLARYYLQQGRALGFASAGQVLSLLPPERGGRQLGKILEALALLRAEGELPLHGLIEIQAQHLSRGSTVVIITPSVHQEVALAADFLLRRGLRPIAVLIDAASFNGAAGTQELVETFRMLNIPVRQVKREMKLDEALAGRYY